MSAQLETQILQELERIPLVDPHSHINPHSAASTTLADIMGYHYYTELAHSAGLPKEQIEEPGIAPREKVARIVPWLSRLENTVQYSWLIEICKEFFQFEDETITANNWEALYEKSEQAMASPTWEKHVLEHSKLEGVFLTNDFDDPLEGFDTNFYIPCLRTDDLVFHLDKQTTRERLEKATGVSVSNPATLVSAIGNLFSHFVSHNAKACAISLPPNFCPAPVSHASVEPSLSKLLQGKELSVEEKNIISQFVFWTLAEHCKETKLPFDLMIGVNRAVYEEGVFQGQDLYDKRTSLIQYRKLFNAFPTVTFPISVLTHMSNQELVSYSWIFPNVVANGHWWYSNIPAYIEPDCRARLQAIPQTKQIGYYSDMYKLEFALPKFRMYRKVLARVLSQDFVQDRGWSESQAIALGELTLRGNVKTIFGR